MTLRNLTPELAERLRAAARAARGVVVATWSRAAPPRMPGCDAGDVIVSVNGATVEDVGEFEREIGKAKADGVARLRVRRGDGYTLVTLRLD